MIFMKPIHNYRQAKHCRHRVVIPHKVNDLIETNSQLSDAFGFNSPGCDSSQS